MSRRLIAAVAVLSLAGGAVPLIASTASEDPDGLAPLVWENAVLIRDDHGRGGSLVVIYDGGVDNAAPRLRLSRRSGVAVLGLRVKAERQSAAVFAPRCARARIKRLPRMLALGVILDEYADLRSDDGAPAGGFVLPPLKSCRVLPVDTANLGV